MLTYQSWFLFKWMFERFIYQNESFITMKNDNPLWSFEKDNKNCLMCMDKKRKPCGTLAYPGSILKFTINCRDNKNNITKKILLIKINGEQFMDIVVPTTNIPTLYPTKLSTSKPDQCDLSMNDKKDCAYPGIDEKGCIRRSCCWNATNGHKYCYQPKGECEVPDANKIDCGHDKIQESECYTRGCCWHPKSGFHYCFNPKRNTTLTTTTTTMTTTTKVLIPKTTTSTTTSTATSTTTSAKITSTLTRSTAIASTGIKTTHIPTTSQRTKISTTISTDLPKITPRKNNTSTIFSIPKRTTSATSKTIFTTVDSYTNANQGKSTVSSAQRDTSSTKDTMLVPLVISFMVVLLIVVSVVCFIVRRRRSKSKFQSKDNSQALYSNDDGAEYATVDSKMKNSEYPDITVNQKRVNQYSDVTISQQRDAVTYSQIAGGQENEGLYNECFPVDQSSKKGQTSNPNQQVNKSGENIYYDSTSSNIAEENGIYESEPISKNALMAVEKTKENLYYDCQRPFSNDVDPNLDNIYESEPVPNSSKEVDQEEHNIYYATNSVADNLPQMNLIYEEGNASFPKTRSILETGNNHYEMNPVDQGAYLNNIYEAELSMEKRSPEGFTPGLNSDTYQEVNHTSNRPGIEDNKTVKESDGDGCENALYAEVFKSKC